MCFYLPFYVKPIVHESLNKFTPLESPSIYAEDGRNRKHQIFNEGEVKALLFLTGFTLRRWEHET
jgi:hypothetical protein